MYMYLWMMCCIHRIIKYICDLFKHAFVSTGYTEAYCFMGEARDLGWIFLVFRQKLEWTWVCLKMLGIFPMK